MSRDEIIKVYTGTEIAVLLLKGLLEENGISSIIRNHFRAGLNAGFMGGTVSTVELFIRESDFSRAEHIIRKFILENSPDPI